jgi:hypothetical protein
MQITYECAMFNYHTLTNTSRGVNQNNNQSTRLVYQRYKTATGHVYQNVLEIFFFHICHPSVFLLTHIISLLCMTDNKLIICARILLYFTNLPQFFQQGGCISYFPMYV